jgi:hypothetical protein
MISTIGMRTATKQQVAAWVGVPSIVANRTQAGKE